MKGTETRDYRNHRLTDEEWDKIQQMRRDELKKHALKKPEPLRNTIQIVIPVHYGSKGLMWQSRFVTEGELEGYAAQYPNMQILDERYKVVVQKKAAPEVPAPEVPVPEMPDPEPSGSRMPTDEEIDEIQEDMALWML